MFREVVNILHIVRQFLPADLPVPSMTQVARHLDLCIWFKDRISLAMGNNIFVCELGKQV